MPWLTKIRAGLRMMVLQRASRSARSLSSLNRDREFATLSRMLELTPADSLLDVGSGDGFWTARFARRVNHVTGLEPDDAMLVYARRLHRQTNVEYVKGTAESLPFPSSAFDKVVSMSSVEHFKDPVNGLREMFRVLRAGGRVAISVDALSPENSSTNFRRWHSARHHVTHYFREDELVTVLTEIGFHVELPTAQLFRSPLSRWARETFIRRPRLLLPLFLVFRALVAAGDLRPIDQHGQIIAVCAVRPAAAAIEDSRPASTTDDFRSD
jgi:ubiquinone/menaquinone biosynthesis C-methylase UbiE